MSVQLRRREFMGVAAAPLLGSSLRGMAIPKIKDVSVITTAPAGVRLVIVKVTTDQDGLYGYGCATFTQRADLVVEAVKPCTTRRTGATARC
jgi:mannonate dehydratase